MERLILLLIVFLTFFACEKEKNPLKPVDDSSNLRIINIIHDQYKILVTGNENVMCDSLRGHRSSGYVDIYSDTLLIKVFEIANNSNAVYDTLLFLNKDTYYTLFIFQRDQIISSLLVEDSMLLSQDCSKMRIFNNSSTGEPFRFIMKSNFDTVSIDSPNLYSMSSYNFLSDTLYTPSIILISSDISGDFEKVSLPKNYSYTIVISDKVSYYDARYPYLSFLFIDINDEGDYFLLL